MGGRHAAAFPRRRGRAPAAAQAVADHLSRRTAEAHQHGRRQRHPGVRLAASRHPRRGGGRHRGGPAGHPGSAPRKDRRGLGADGGQRPPGVRPARQGPHAQDHDPGATGADVRQLQTALRRLGFGAPNTGVFDSATTAAVRRWYAKRGYTAQEPDLTAKQTREQLRQAVQVAEEALLTDRKALEAGRDVLPLKLKLDNARKDLRAAEDTLEEEDSADLTPEETRQVEDLRRAVRAGEEEALAAEQALTAARSPRPLPTAAPETALPTPRPSSALPRRSPRRTGGCWS
ncbi:peptidoglycan-binding protein [Streptosporangium lutulentum]